MRASPGEEDELCGLLTSPTVRQLTWLAVNLWRDPDKGPLSLSPDLAAALTNTDQLPHLACLCLTVNHCPPPSREILLGSPSLAWVSLECNDIEDITEDIRARRELVAPDRWPPVDVRGGDNVRGNEHGGAPV